jgi:isoleucyl-tRNA synthetase
MREQIRLWFYSQCFMAVTLDGRSPYGQVLTYEKVLDEHGRPMHKSTGNAIELGDALERMGADVARWLYCEQTPSQPLRFGYTMADDVKRRLLTFWNSAAFFVTYARIESFDPSEPAGELRPLDRWLVARTSQLVRDATDAYERFWTPGVVSAFESFVDDLSNWYIRRSRRRFWGGDHTALRVLWDSLTRAIQVIAPVMPFLAEDLWRRLVGPEQSVFLAGWPEAGAADDELLAEVADVRRVVELGRRARDSSRLKLRQPLRRLIVEGGADAAPHADEIAEELRVKEVVFGPVEASELRVKPNLPALGPKLGKELGAVRAALQGGDFEELPGGRFRAAGHELEPDEVLVERAGKEGWAVAAEDGLTVALDTALDAELEREGRVYDLIHQVNSMRKQQGLEITDRIRLQLPSADADLLDHVEWIKEETLAVSVEADGGGEPAIAKA